MFSYYIRSRLHLFLLEHVVLQGYPIAKYNFLCFLGTGTVHKLEKKEAQTKPEMSV
jgi:hypothetical protein